MKIIRVELDQNNKTRGVTIDWKNRDGTVNSVMVRTFESDLEDTLCSIVKAHKIEHSDPVETVIIVHAKSETGKDEWNIIATCDDIVEICPMVDPQKDQDRCYVRVN